MNILAMYKYVMNNLLTIIKTKLYSLNINGSFIRNRYQYILVSILLAF